MARKVEALSGGSFGLFINGVLRKTFLNKDAIYREMERPKRKTKKRKK